MRRYFGTDGIRGIINQDLVPDIAFKVGNALSVLKRYPVVLIGRDTRQSGDTLALCLASGVCSGGGNVIDVGIVPTAGVAYLTKYFNADYGVVISASHNPAEYNGIKIFNSRGFKLLEDEEEEVESCFNTTNLISHPKLGSYKKMDTAVDFYVSYLVKTCGCDLSGLKVVLDCANGAAHYVAPEVFKKLGAEVLQYFTENSGIGININCGSLHPEKLREKVLSKKADVGFAFDGDSDRLLAVNEKGEYVNGDLLIYALAKDMHVKGQLKGDMVIGTHHTNMGIQKALDSDGIKLFRADIGDKYVMEMMLKKDAVLGGEQSGHIILLDYMTTGDGILAAINIAGMMKKENKKLSEFCDVKMYPQTNINIQVKDKIRIMNNEELAEFIDACRKELGGSGRVLVRASGTEPQIRVMVECEYCDRGKETAERIADFVRNINN